MGRDMKTLETTTQRYRMGELGTKIAEFKRSLPHTCEYDPRGRCLKCDINAMLSDFERLSLRHFPK
jgi:hypothetical protein